MASHNSNSSVPTPVSFPQPEDLGDTNASSTTDTSNTKSRQRTSTTASTTSNRIRSASIKLMEANPPPGMWAATGATASKAPSLADIRRGSFGSEGWNEHRQRKRASSRASQGDKTKSSTNAVIPPAVGTEPFPAVTEEESHQREPVQRVPMYDGQDKELGATVDLRQSTSITDKNVSATQQPLHGSGQYANGYVPPPKLPWKRSFAIGLTGFSKWVMTPSGFLITLYGLNVVAWGGMLFLLLCNASPAMCTPTCNDINSPRRKWIEWDSQILNALFCVTGFGLAPWRFRDLYWWGWWRIGGSQRKQIGIRRLAGIHKGWFRLPGSESLPELANASTVDPEDPAVPIPAAFTPDPPPTGMRAPPTKSWKMDFVLWNNAGNTFVQIILCFYMWHYDRFKRPSWATGLFVAIGCIVAGIAGIMMWHEGKNIKKIEGVPMRKEYDVTPSDVEGHSAQIIPLVTHTGTTAKS